LEEITKIVGELSPDSAIKEDEKDTDEVKELKQKRRSTSSRQNPGGKWTFRNLTWRMTNNLM